MAHGFWGSAFPIGNFLFSRLIFAAVAWRITSRKILNRVKVRMRPLDIQAGNDSHTAEQLNKWLDAGFLKLNVGGGPKNLRGFVNLDFVRHPNVEREVVANILDLSFIRSNTLTQIHSNHVVEHLTEAELQAQFSEYHRILKPAGRLTIRCPNALGVSFAFWFSPVIESNRDEFVLDGFPEDEDFGNPADAWAHKDLYGFLHWIYGDMGNVTNQHLNLVTPSRLVSWLNSNGFRMLRISEPEAVNIVVVAIRA